MLQNCCFILTNNIFGTQCSIFPESIPERASRKTQSVTQISQSRKDEQMSTYQILKNINPTYSKVEKPVRIQNISQLIRQNRSKTLSLIPTKIKKGISIHSRQLIKNQPQSTQVMQSYRSYNQLSIRNSVDVAVNIGFSEMLKSDKNSKQMSPINMLAKQPRSEFFIGYIGQSHKQLDEDSLHEQNNRKKKADYSEKGSNKTNKSQQIIWNSKKPNKIKNTSKGSVKLKINSQQLINNWNQAKQNNMRGVIQIQSRLYQQQVNRVQFKNIGAEKFKL